MPDILRCALLATVLGLLAACGSGGLQPATDLPPYGGGGWGDSRA